MKRFTLPLLLLTFMSVVPHLAAQSTYSQTDLPCYAWGCSGATFSDGSTLSYSLVQHGTSNGLAGNATLNGIAYYDALGSYEYDPANRPANCIVGPMLNCYHISFSFDGGKYRVDEWIQFRGTRTPIQHNVDGSLTY